MMLLCASAANRKAVTFAENVLISFQILKIGTRPRMKKQMRPRLSIRRLLKISKKELKQIKDKSNNASYLFHNSIQN
jgi:hypothetical protein